LVRRQQSGIPEEAFSADGAAQPNMSGGQIEGLEIPCPPLPMQRRIAGILSAYDELIENSQRRIRILESMARALYREWFVHFRFPGHEKHPHLDSALGAIPQGWAALHRLGEFVSDGSVTLQTSPFGTQLKASQYTDEGTPVINVRNIGFGVLKADKLEFLPPSKPKNTSATSCMKVTSFLVERARLKGIFWSVRTNRAGSKAQTAFGSVC